MMNKSKYFKKKGEMRAWEQKFYIMVTGKDPLEILKQKKKLDGTRMKGLNLNNLYLSWMVWWCCFLFSEQSML
jgi:hypothetical protein